MTGEPDLQTLLARLDVPAFGRPDADGEERGDDRGGRYWLVTRPQVRTALKFALITGRPLFVSGPSGTGKSALARAVAETLGWSYYEVVVTSQTRLDELTGSVDLVQRLNEAEVAGRMGTTFPRDLDAFVRPGVLWWALDPDLAEAAGQGGHRDPRRAPREPDPDGGAVVLIDEIDKAEPDLPNNLLVPLGSWELPIEGRASPVTLGPRRRHRPLVIITSNQERDMPAAFLRRCVVLALEYPDADALMDIAEHHVASSTPELRAQVRRAVLSGAESRISPAEFVDAVRAADGLQRAGKALDAALWEDIRTIVLGQGPDQP